MKKILYFLLTLFLFLPISVNAKLMDNYKDIVNDITNAKTKNGVVNVYLFYGDGCPHCAKEKVFLEKIKKVYKDKINIITYETWYDKTNSKNLSKVAKKLKLDLNGVPFTVIGEDYYIGYNESVGNDIELSIKRYFTEYQEELAKKADEVEISNAAKETENENIYRFPLLGVKTAKEVSIPILSVVLGLIDGFNPCAMWILLFLINILIGMKNKKKMFLFGFTFLFTSALVYFLSMLGINLVLGMSTITYVRIGIAIVGLIAGIINIYTYFKTRKETGCHVIDDNKRKNILSKIKNYTNKNNVFIGIIGIAILAISVNLVELACSLGFPAVFAEILAINKVTGLKRIIFLLIYTFFYMLDDMIVFTLSMLTLKYTVISNKFSKYSNLIGGIIMIILGILLIFKPEIIMLNI